MSSFLGDDGALIIFGGSTDASIKDATSLLNDLWAFCLSNHTWVRLAPSGVAPTARHSHGMEVVGSQVRAGDLKM